MSKVWVVRAGDSIKHQEFALEKGCVVIGFSAIAGSMKDLDTREKAFAAVPNKGLSKQQIAIRAYQPYHFAHTIEDGDYVIMPGKKAVPSGLTSTGSSAIGKVKGSYLYVENAEEGCKHQRKVQWLNKEFSNESIPGRASLSSLITVFLMRNTKADDLKLALRGVVSSSIGATDNSSRAVDVAYDEFDPQNIQAYMWKEFPGDDLCDLIKEILTAMGYDCELTPRSNDGGIDIIVYQNLVESFGVEVKNRGVIQGAAAIREFDSALKGRKGIFVSRSGFGTSTTENKIKKDYPSIRLWDAAEIERLVKKYYGKFSEKFKRDRLPLKTVWEVDSRGGSADEAEA